MRPRLGARSRVSAMTGPPPVAPDRPSLLAPDDPGSATAGPSAPAVPTLGSENVPPVGVFAPDLAGSLPAADPTMLHDLALDQVFSALVHGREEYDLSPLLARPLERADEIVARQDVFRDLERDAVRGPVERFARSMRSVRAAQATSAKMRQQDQRARLFLESAVRYRAAVEELLREVGDAGPRSRGLRELVEFGHQYLASPSFRQLCHEIDRLLSELRSVAYTVQFRGDRVTVAAPAGEGDYGEEIVATFARFPGPDGRDPTFSLHEWSEMNHVEEEIQDRVALLFPAVFAELRTFPARHAHFADAVFVELDRQLQFYLGYGEIVTRLRSRGLSFSYPELSDRASDLEVRDTFDLALALRLPGPPVVNDLRLAPPERIAIVSGPNNGGKTTFARTIGQLHYLARLGCPVPGSFARLLRSDRILTHFERGERLADLRGKLLDELVQVHAILQVASERSVIVLNETFASAMVHDALFLGRRVLELIRARGALCVYVTFLDELSTLGAETVSVVSTVSPEDPEVRTYRLARRPADGRAHALAVARKYGLTYEALTEGRDR